MKLARPAPSRCGVTTPERIRERTRAVESPRSSATSRVEYAFIGVYLAARFLAAAFGFATAVFFSAAALRGLLAGGEAGLQRFHDVDDLVLRLRRRRERDVLAFDLALDQRQHALADFVLVSLGLELFARGLLDELRRQLELGRFQPRPRSVLH